MNQLENGKMISPVHQKKILVSDYDYTFYLNDEDLEKNKIAVKKFREAGNIFVVATGRSYQDFHEKVFHHGFDYDYVILNHGAMILDNQNRIFVNFMIPDDVILPIREDLQLEKSVYWFCCSKLESRVDFSHKELTKINVSYKTREETIQMNQQINEKYAQFVHSYHVSKNALEIISNQIDKSKAIELLLEQLNIPKESVYTIGDGYNDIPMVKDFSGYAMANSVIELKQVARKEYESVSELINEIM